MTSLRFRARTADLIADGPLRPPRARCPRAPGARRWPRRRGGLAPRPAAAAPSDAVGSALQARRDAAARLRQATDALDSALAEQARAGQTLTEATDRATAADRAYEVQRKLTAQMGAEAYVRHGGDTSQHDRDVMSLVMTGREALLAKADTARRDALEALDKAQRDVHRAAQDVADTTSARDKELEATTRADDAADRAIAATGATDLPAVAYDAYLQAADTANQESPSCKLPASLLAGIGRIASNHGRALGSSVDPLGEVSPALRGLRLDGRTGANGTIPDTDGGAIDGDPKVDRAVGPMQLLPRTWAALGADADGNGTADPDNLFDASLTTARMLCQSGASLDGYAGLVKALYAYSQDGAQVDAVLAVARRYGSTRDLDMGVIPPDPQASAASDGTPQFDPGGPSLPAFDIGAMLAWAQTRLGTPYSQCLGPEARPQDPVCPLGTNRFGAGFFDCSGFVSTAYRKIGIAIPTTTYAMAADARFMGTKVADRLDLHVAQPGDVFLMNGHTGLYVGGGMIIHAIGRGLTLEPVPAWVANGTFALLRPIQLANPAAPRNLDGSIATPA